MHSRFMRSRVVQIFLILLGAAALSSCGGKDSDSVSAATDAGKDTVQIANPLACGTATCAGATEYCLMSIKGHEIESARCAPRPASCESCECAREDAIKLYREAKQCKIGIVACSYVEGQLIVSCTRNG